MKKMIILLTVFLMIAVTSCTERPFGGSSQIYTKSKTDSKQRQMFICSYIPLDTVFEYHDSLVDIKFTMKEAYAEIECWQLFRWPPYIIPRFKRDSTSFVFHCLFSTDSTTTHTDVYSPNNNWWKWSCTAGEQSLDDFWCFGERLFDEASLDCSLDTIAFPVYFGSTYKSIAWPNSCHNDYVPIGFIRFARDTTDCETLFFSIKDTILNDAQEYTRRGIEEYHAGYAIKSLNWHTIEEMNAKYKKNMAH